MTAYNSRTSVWHSPEDAPPGCTCRSKHVTKVTHIFCGGCPDERECPGMSGWVGPGGQWCEDLPPLPPQSPMLDPGRYDAHAHRAVELLKEGKARSLAAACKQAVAEMGRGHGWGADDNKTGVPDRLYRRAIQFRNES